jgi:bacterioferritin-associated ferredoxin
MCDICRKSPFVGSDRIGEGSPADCSWPLDETRRACLESATVEVRQRVVVEHRCGPCMAAVENVTRAGGVLGGCGVSLTYESVAIGTQESCGRCGRPAPFAWTEFIRMPLCSAHAALNGWLPRRKRRPASVRVAAAPALRPTVGPRPVPTHA